MSINRHIIYTNRHFQIITRRSQQPTCHFRFAMRCVLLVLFGVAACAFSRGRVHPRDIEVITLRAGSYTEGRRSLRIPQLLAVDAPPDVAWRADSVQCTNVGWDGRDVQWRCETHDMPSDLKFGRMEVNCEGYESPDDEYVLEGSCGLEYELLRNRPVPTTHYTYESSPPFTHKDTAAFFLVIALIAAAATIYIFVSWVLECCCNSARRVATHTDVYGDTSTVYHTGPPPVVYARSPPVVVYASTPPVYRPATHWSSTGSTPTRKATGFANHQTTVKRAN